MVSIGKPVEDLLADPGAEDNFQYSVEFCGGTHLGNTSGAQQRSFTTLSIHPKLSCDSLHRFQSRSATPTVARCNCGVRTQGYHNGHARDPTDFTAC